MQLCPGCDFCQNGGLCQAGPVSYSCICPTGFTGQNCGTQSSCSPGTALSSGVCHLCSAGTFSTDGESCVRCQLGTSSNATAATESCSPCSSGTFAPDTTSTSCFPCPSCSQIGSIVPNAYSPSLAKANQSSVPSNDKAAIPPTPISGWVFVGVLIAFMLISTIILIPFRRQTCRYVSAVAVILRTPFNFLRVVPSSWHVIEIPSFYRGLVALWVIAGLILITAYQSEVFVTEGVITQSDVQPGARFTSGDPRPRPLRKFQS